MLRLVDYCFGGDGKNIYQDTEFKKQPNTFVENFLKENNIIIEVDGGVSLSNAGKLIEVGANVLVAGNTVFSSENPTETIHLLKTVTSHNIEVR